MKFLVPIALLFALVSCSNVDVGEPTKPTTPVTKPDPVKPKPSGKCIPVRDMNGNSLGVGLTLKDHCNLQLQGSGFIDGKMYGYWKKTSAHRVDCSSISSKISGTVKFRQEKTKYGTGVKLWPLTPYKSIAVDPKFIPYGSKIFIPALKGTKYPFEGKTLTHDGYMIAQDTGGAIKGDHIDFFIGPHDKSWSELYKFVAKYFPFVKSKSRYKFDAYLNGKKIRIWSTFYYLPLYKSCK